MLTNTPKMSDVQLAIGIQYAPWDDKRTVNANRLHSQLIDAGFHCELVKASQSEPVWETCKRGWRQVPNSEDTHMLMLQGDVKTCDNFGELVRRAVTARPNAAISTFCMRGKATERAREQGYNWIRVTEGLWGQGILLPVDWITDMIQWNERTFTAELTDDDPRIAMWLEHDRNELAWCTVPSLVEHVGHDDSLLNNSAPRDRTASWYEQQPDSESIDFTKTENPPVTKATSVIKRYEDLIIDDPRE